ncbi:MAG: VWA domain-containing protein [Promethearchaeota archaeon]
MPEYESQNLAIILDASRSMFRRDYNPNRFEACKQGIINLVEKRMTDESKTGFALIYVGQEVKTLLDFGDYCSPDIIREKLDSIKIGGQSKIIDGIGLAIKLHIEDIRKAGAKVPRIVLFSDGKLTKSKVGPTNIAKIAAGLEIKIDTIRLGEVEHFNVMKRMSELTDGRYWYCNDTPSLLLATAELAASNQGKKYTKSKNYSKILEKIAVPLKTEFEITRDAAELAEKIRGSKSLKKCGICFQEQDPITKAPFTVSGRYCPNCGQGFHIYCISEWAKNDKESSGLVTRCPHCFYLIKIPAEVQQVKKIHEEFKREEKRNMQSTGTERYFARHYIARDLGEDALYSACPVCNTIFDEDEEVVKCGNPKCSAIYHLDCFEQIRDKPCKVCGKIISDKL